jgi:hypothetical protein
MRLAAPPTDAPSLMPTTPPTEMLKTIPPSTDTPSFARSQTPTEVPSRFPTAAPTRVPLRLPTNVPTAPPTKGPASATPKEEGDAKADCEEITCSATAEIFENDLKRGPVCVHCPEPCKLVDQSDKGWSVRTLTMR